MEKKAISQSNNEESIAILNYAEELKIDKSFIEFRFGTFQYNSIDLTKKNYKGLLIDATKSNCDHGNKIFKSLKLNVTAICQWITLESLEKIIDFVKKKMVGLVYLVLILMVTIIGFLKSYLFILNLK